MEQLWRYDPTFEQIFIIIYFFITRIQGGKEIENLKFPGEDFW